LIVCGSNSSSAQTVEIAAARGIHCLIEKPMAATAAQAHRMAKAAEKGKARLMVNWPLAWNASVVKALEMLEDGDIGQVFHARVHMAHQGPKEAGCTPYFYNWLYDAKENGGGAILDYCCYGANIFATLWGRPSQVFGVARNLVKPNFPVDDNAMITAVYDDRICLTQASWTQNPDYHDSLFLGSKGTLETQRGKLIRSHTNPKDFNHHGASSLVVREVELEALPAGRRNGPEHFLSCLRSDKPFYKLCSAESGVIAQEILSAGVDSEKTGKRITLAKKGKASTKKRR